MPDLEGKKQETKLEERETLIFHTILLQKLWMGVEGSLQVLSHFSEELGASLKIQRVFLCIFPASASSSDEIAKGLAVRLG